LPESAGRCHRRDRGCALKRPAADAAEPDLDFAKMQQLEILALAFFAVQRIFVALAQEAQVAGAFEILELYRLAPKLPVVGANRPRILRAAVNHLFFAVTLNLEFDGLRG